MCFHADHEVGQAPPAAHAVNGRRPALRPTACGRCRARYAGRRAEQFGTHVVDSATYELGALPRALGSGTDIDALAARLYRRQTCMNDVLLANCDKATAFTRMNALSLQFLQASYASQLRGQSLGCLAKCGSHARSMDLKKSASRAMTAALAGDSSLLDRHCWNASFSSTPLLYKRLHHRPGRAAEPACRDYQHRGVSIGVPRSPPFNVKAGETYRWGYRSQRKSLAAR